MKEAHRVHGSCVFQPLLGSTVVSQQNTHTHTQNHLLGRAFDIDDDDDEEDDDVCVLFFYAAKALAVGGVNVQKGSGEGSVKPE